MKQNYQLILDKLIEKECADGHRPSLLLHACCAPCSSYTLEYLSKHFDITLFFYNPNIYPEEEYRLREDELVRLVSQMGLADSIKVIHGKYEPEIFFDTARGYETFPEGGARCERCFRLRLSESADVAAKQGFDFYTTTLSISPHKNAELLNSIGEEEGVRAGVRYLASDFKKRNGYKRSCELSEQYGLYRQDFCGCIYSKKSSSMPQ